MRCAARRARRRKRTRRNREALLLTYAVSSRSLPPSHYSSTTDILCYPTTPLVGKCLHRRELLLQELALVELGVEPAFGDELRVRAALDDPPLVEHQDQVRV